MTYYMLTQKQHILNWLLLTMFFFIHYFVRISPALMSIELMTHFSISIRHIGLVSSLYFLTYTFSQVPVGYVIKTYSTRTLVGGASLACAITALSFSLSTTFPFALISLLLFAFFGSFGFIGSVAYATQHIPAHQSLLIGLTQSLGMAAGFVATNVISSQLNIRSWQEITQCSAISLAVMGCVILVCIPSTAATAQPIDTETAKTEVTETEPAVSIYRNIQTWINALYAGFLYVPMMVFTEGGVGVHLLRSIHLHSKDAIAFAISMSFVGWMLGGPICGWLSERYGCIKLMRASAISGIIMVGLVMFIPMSMLYLSICLFIFGLTNTGIIGCYVISAEKHGPKNASVSIALTSMMSMLVGSLLGGFLPTLLERTSQATWSEGIPYYHAEDYQRIFGTPMMCTSFCAYLCAAFIRDLPKKISQTES